MARKQSRKASKLADTRMETLFNLKKLPTPFTHFRLEQFRRASGLSDLLRHRRYINPVNLFSGGGMLRADNHTSTTPLNVIAILQLGHFLWFLRLLLRLKTFIPTTDFLLAL